MTEELFSGSRDSVEADNAAENRESILRTLTESKYLVDDAEITALLSSVNFDELQRIFTREVHRSDPQNPARAHVIHPDRIIFTNSEGMRAAGNISPDKMAYVPQAEMILVDVDAVKGSARILDIPLALTFIYNLFHEEGHAVSAYSDTTRRSGSRIVRVGVQQMHFQRDSAGPTAFFWLLNEGINEKWSRLLAQEYLASSPMRGVAKSDIERLVDIYHPQAATGAYFVPVHFANAMVDKISRETGIETDKVWQSFIDASIRGFDLYDKRARRILDFPFKTGFTEKLMHADGAHMHKMLDEFEMPYESKRYLIGLVKDFHEPRGQ